MIEPTGRLIAACLGCGLICVALAPSASASETRFSLSATADSGYSNNPFHGDSGGGNSGGVFVGGRLQPSLEVLTQYDTLSVSGSARLQRYLSNSRKQDDFSAGAELQHRLSEHDTVSGGLSFSDNNNSLQNLAESGTDTSLPVTGTDLNLIGRSSQRYGGHAEGALTLSARMSAQLGVNADLVHFASVDGRDYRNFGGSASLMRQLAEHFRLGVFANASRSIYDGDIRPDSTVVSGGVTFSLQINARWDINGQVGASRVEYGQGQGQSSSLVGNLRACRSGGHDSLCVTAARQYLPTSALGTRPQTTLRVNYQRDLDGRNSVSLGIGYLHSASVANSTARSFADSEASYSRQLSLKMRASVSGFYRKLFDQGADRPADYGGRLSLTYKFGDSR